MTTETISMREKRALKRVTATDMTAVEEVLKVAMYSIVPDDQTQRQAFEKLMPYVYVLRNKGCSWSQLANLLSKCGFELQPSTVRSYFSEMLATRMEMCKERMNEQIEVLDVIRKQTRGEDLSGLVDKVVSTVKQRRAEAAPRINEALGGNIKASPAAIQPISKPTVEAALRRQK